jgi:acetyl esterase/lipase
MRTAQSVMRNSNIFKIAIAMDFEHQQDVVYGYKDGMGLLMDVFIPKDHNGAGIIRIMAGGLTSSPTWSHQAASDASVQNLLKAGYIVFAVAHSSQPKYTIDDILPDVPRAVRFIRYHSERFGITPDRIGITGLSSAGHIALMTATYPPVASSEAQDPIDRESSQVQVVVAYFPGADILNFGTDHTTILEHFHSQGFKADAAFDFHQWNDNTNRYERVIEIEKVRAFYRKNSSTTHVSASTPPILLFHGDKDKLVPIQQSKLLIASLVKMGVPHKLIVAEGEGHGWESPLENEFAETLAWFGQYLLENES